MIIALLYIGAALAPAPAVDAVQRALVVPGARVEVASISPEPRCAPIRAEARAPIAASGRVALHLVGAGCEGWTFASVRVFAQAFVAARAIREGEPLASAVTRAEREMTVGDGFITELPEGATAAVSMQTGALVRRVRAAGVPTPGAAVNVEVRSGSLVVMQPARAVACPGGAACAVLPSGKRVEGRLIAGRIVVEAP